MLSPPLSGGGNRYSERLSNSLKDTQLLNTSTGVQTRLAPEILL